MLTQRDEQGNWSLKGVSWNKLRPGSILDNKTRERLYGALWRLMEYEDTGLDPEQVRELAERNRAVKPKTDTLDKPAQIGKITFREGTSIHHCPNCGRLISISNKFCQECGQMIRWEDRVEEEDKSKKDRETCAGWKQRIMARFERVD